jgi:hypothetical protein
MKKIILILPIIISITSCKSPSPSKSIWTEAYEMKEYQQIDSALKLRMPEKEKRAQLASYFVKRLKSELPRGLKSVSADSLKKLSRKIATEYAYTYNDGHGNGLKPRAYAWTPDLEDLLKAGMLRELKMENIQNPNIFCDCALTKLKKIYPDSIIMPAPHNVLFKIGIECRTELLVKERK